MLPESPYFTGFLVGLMGGVHCVGMCGGIVTALSFGIEKGSAGKPNNGMTGKLGILLGYNLGRLFSYLLLGALAGGLGAAASGLGGLQQIRVALELVSVVIMFALGLYLGGWWYGVARIERLGAGVWKYIEPLGRRLIPVRHVGPALVLGAIWGWLPCGLVYSMLIWALSSASPLNGALMMASFGLGTLPNLLLMGVFTARLGEFLRRKSIRHVAGAIVMMLAIVQLLRFLGVM